MANKPELDFILDTDYPVSLVFDSPINGTNNFGEWNMYTVNYGGNEVVFFASDGCHKQLSQYGKGAELNIKKVYYGDEGKTKYEVTPLGGVQDTAKNGSKSPVNGGYTPTVRERTTNNSIESQVALKAVVELACNGVINLTQSIDPVLIHNAVDLHQIILDIIQGMGADHKIKDDQNLPF